MKKNYLFILIMIMIISVVGFGKSAVRKEADDTSSQELSKEQLLSGYWYFNMSSSYFLQIEFNEDGTYDGVMISKNSDEQMDGKWKYGDSEQNIMIAFDNEAEAYSLFYYDKSDECFKFTITDDMPAEQQEIGRQYKIVRSERALSATEIHSLIYNEYVQTDVDPLEAARVEKDKLKIHELYRAIENTLLDIYENVKINPNQVKVNESGEINIADLFDTSSNVGAYFVEELERTLDTNKIVFNSRMKNDCSIQIVEFDVVNGKVVIQVTSEAADVKFYIENFSEKEGDYSHSETATEGNEESEIYKSLLNDNWYLTFWPFIKMDFKENGMWNGLMISKYHTVQAEEEDMNWSYKDDTKSIILEIYNRNFELFYNEDSNSFELSAEDMMKYGEEFRYVKLVKADKEYDELDREFFINICTLVNGEGEYSEYFDMANDPIEQTRTQMDKSAIAELQHLISILMADEEEYDGVKASSKATKVNANGEIFIADLFDTTNDAGKKIVESIKDDLDEKLVLTSRIKQDCTIQIVELNIHTGRVVIQVISEVADQQFYMDYSGTYDGVYGA